MRKALAALALAAACGSSETTPAADPEAVRAGIASVVAKDARLAVQTPLAPADYGALAEQIAAVPGVAAAEYAGDTLGTIYAQVDGAGILVYRHIRDDWHELETLPPEADFSAQLHAKYNAGWTTDLVDWPQSAAAAVDQNTFFTRFPVARIDPDPEYTKDAALQCPSEGKIALVDFQYSDMNADTRDAMSSDGIMLYDRVRAMADAAGFKLDFYRDDQINTSNFKLLEDYTIVIVIGHGGFPNMETAQRVKLSMPTLATPEVYDAKKPMTGGMTQYEAWQKGYILRNVEDSKTTVKWSPLLFRDLYQPKVPQLFMINSCWGLLTKDDQGFGRTGKVYNWGKNGGRTTLYNLGDGLMDAGVKVVFGYVSPASPMAILENTMIFFRRMYGGYYGGDRPPSRFPQTYWPTCMGAQTYFRRPDTPDKAIYANKDRGGSVYTMYAVPENQYLREVCAYGNQHAQLQDFTLKTGAPAVSFLDCWSRWWSQGEDPTGVQDAYCSMGDPAVTEEKTRLAACAVKIARKVTNLMLQ